MLLWGCPRPPHVTVRSEAFSFRPEKLKCLYTEKSMFVNSITLFIIYLENYDGGKKSTLQNVLAGLWKPIHDYFQFHKIKIHLFQFIYISITLIKNGKLSQYVVLRMRDGFFMLSKSAPNGNLLRAIFFCFIHRTHTIH